MKLLKSNDKFCGFNSIKNMMACAGFCHFSSLFRRGCNVLSDFPVCIRHLPLPHRPALTELYLKLYITIVSSVNMTWVFPRATQPSQKRTLYAETLC